MKNIFEIYALRYAGPVKRPAAVGMWNRDWGELAESSYYIWLIKGENENILVDTGIHPIQAEKMQLLNYVNPAELVTQINLKPEDINKIIITHLHLDHTNGVTLFPKASFYIQESEYNFWLKNPLAKRPPFMSTSDQESYKYLESLEGTDRLKIINGNFNIVDGIDCILSAGHTFGNQSVLVNTKKGIAIIGSDCGYYFKNYQEDWPSIYITNLPEWLKSYSMLREKVSSIEYLFPGHDPLMYENYPKITKNISRLV
ncbi:MAG: N-acyl homoserine lactonase family protein [Atribacterota bacterium]|nr:N-acyl homoserine lactonase family protein [Atribacterota bacterium]